MFGLSKPLIAVIAALLVTNGVTAWTTKLYHAKFSAAVAECDADKLRSALEAEQATSAALRRSIAALQKIRVREQAAAESAILALRSASQRLADELQTKQRELNEAIRDSGDGCLVQSVPDGVWNALRGDSNGRGGGSGTGSDLPAS